MRSNGHPSLAISTLSPLHLDLHEGKNAWIVCPEHGCGRWVEVHRGLVQVHRRDGVRCAGSRRHVTFDLSPAQHERRHALARRATVCALRKGAPVDLVARATPAQTRAALEAAWRQVARIPVAPAPHQIAARRTLAAA